MVILDPIFVAAGFSYGEIRKSYLEHNVEMLRRVMNQMTTETLRKARADEVADYARHILLELNSELAGSNRCID